MNNFSINVPMLRRNFWRLFGYKSYEEVCDKKWTISPSSFSITRQAISLPKETDKVTGVEEHTNIINEKLRINGGRREHAATVGRILQNVDFLDGYIYKKSAKIQVGLKKEKLLQYGYESSLVDHASLACTLFGSKYFGHWMSDSIALFMAAEELAPPIRSHDLMTVHQQQYSSILGMEYTQFTGGKIRELFIVEDFSQNKYKRDRYEKIREKFNRIGNYTKHQGVIILRGTTGVSRALINERDVANYLQSIGFNVIDPQLDSAEEIVQKILGARIVIGVEGSHLSHGLFSMASDGTLFVLQPPYRFNNVYKDRTDCLDLNYAFMVGDACEGGFTICIDKLKKTLDLIFNKIK